MVCGHGQERSGAATTSDQSVRPVAGVDACKAGWICIVSGPQGALAPEVFTTFDSLLCGLDPRTVIGIDIPIGLPDQGARGCDVAARVLLGWPRRCSVFPAPLRPVLAATSYADACRVRHAIEGKKMSRQAWAITPKVREIDTALRADPALLDRVFEVHPEVSFAAWNYGTPMRSRKKSKAGREARLRVVETVWPGAFEDFRESFLVKEVAHDDLLDALAACWSAVRICDGVAERIPALPEDRPTPVPTDSAGLPMAIWF
jgi:predicted RNase H-like nuclease